MSVKFQRINENIFKLAEDGMEDETMASSDNATLEANIRQMRNTIMSVVDKMPYDKLKRLHDGLVMGIKFNND